MTQVHDNNNESYGEVFCTDERTATRDEEMYDSMGDSYRYEESEDYRADYEDYHDLNEAEYEDNRDLTGTEYEDYRDLTGTEYEDYRDLTGTEYEDYRNLTEAEYEDYRDLTGTEYEDYRDLTGTEYEDYRDLTEAEYEDYHDLTGTETKNTDEVQSLDATEYYKTEAGTVQDTTSGQESIINSLEANGLDASNLVLGAITLASGASAMVMNLRKKVKNKAIEYINLAEEEFANESNAAQSKKLYAVQALTNSVPVLMRPFVSTNFADNAIESGFSSMRKFANLRSGKENNTTDKVIASDCSEEKSPVVINLFVEQPDGTIVKEKRKQINREEVNINIGYKCEFAGEKNGFCKDCVFNKED